MSSFSYVSEGDALEEFHLSLNATVTDHKAVGSRGGTLVFTFNCPTRDLAEDPVSREHDSYFTLIRLIPGNECLAKLCVIPAHLLRSELLVV